jgi:predicted nucleotidyltransferase
MSLDDLRSLRREILSAASRHGARDVRVFGSIVRGEEHSNSDIDLLVDVEAGRSLLDIIGLEQELEELLGRRVEVLTVGGLSPYLERQILAEAAPL